jgi:hypothetical protein
MYMIDKSVHGFRALSSDTLIMRGEDLINAEIDNEAIVLSVAQGFCYGLNGVGSRIWRLLETPTRISDLCATLLTEYNVDPDACERQVLDLLEELRTERLIIAHEEK